VYLSVLASTSIFYCYYDKVDIKPQDRILDAGCGIGGSSIWMAKNFKNQAIGITISPKQVAYAKKQAKRKNVADWVDLSAIALGRSALFQNHARAITVLVVILGSGWSVWELNAVDVHTDVTGALLFCIFLL
jgi:methylase of polypeptide subunit release factors